MRMGKSVPVHRKILKQVNNLRLTDTWVWLVTLRPRNPARESFTVFLKCQKDKSASVFEVGAATSDDGILKKAFRTAALTVALGNWYYSFDSQVVREFLHRR